MDRGFLFFLLLLEWICINTTSVSSHSSVIDSYEVQHIQTPWNGEDAEQSSPQTRSRRQYTPDINLGETEVPSSNTRSFNVSFTSDINESLKGITTILRIFNVELNGKDPFRIIFQCYLPKKATEDYVGKLMTDLRSYLQDNLPATSMRTVKAQFQKKKDGSIFAVVITITVLGSKSQIEYLQVDLSKPNTNVRKTISTTLIKTIKSPSGSSDNEREINLSVNPPVGADNLVQQHITNTLRCVLTNFTEGSDISMKTLSTENDDGSLNKITYKITMGSVSRFLKHISFNFSQNNDDFNEIVRDILETFRKQAIPDLNIGEYVRLSLEILPRNDLTNDLKQRYLKILSSELKKIFPDFNASVRTNITKLTGKFNQFIIIIKPKNSIGDMDLSKSGAADNRMEQLEDILTNLKMKIYNEYPQGGNATFSMQVQLPEKCDDITLDESVNSIRTAIMKALENDEYSVKLKLTEDFLGNNMTLKITALLHPNIAQENDEITKRLNLNNDEDDIYKELRSFLATSSTEISQKLMNNLPVKLKFVSSSAKVTDDSLIDDTASKVHRHVSTLYPNNQIDVKAIKDKKGNYILINILSRIPPTSPETLAVDLTAPGKSLLGESSGIIQYINKVLSENHQNEEPLNIALDVKVSKKFNKKQMENMTNAIVTIITQAFPNYSTKVDNGPILSLKENSASLYYLLSMKTKQKNHELHITSDGKNIIEDISQVLLDVTSQYDEFPTEGQFVNFLLKIFPTDKPTEEFVKDMRNRIQGVMPKLLPNYSITIKMEQEKDSEGFIAEIKMFFSIQPKLIDDDTSDKTTKKSKIEHTIKGLLLEDFNAGARSSSLLIDSNEVQDVQTPWNGKDAQQSSLQTRSRRQYTPDINLGEPEVPSSNTRNFNLSFTTDIHESLKGITTILRKFNVELNGKDPFRIIFQCYLPKKATEDYVGKLMADLRNYLQDNLPATSMRTVKAQFQKKKDGSIFAVVITITVLGSKSQIEYLQVDLSKPNTNVRKTISTTLIKTMKTPSGSSDNEREINLSVNPPVGADNLVQQHITNTLRCVLTNFTEGSDISMKTLSTENDDGSLNKIRYKITMGSVSRFLKHISFNFSQNNDDFKEIVRDILETFRKQAMPDLNSGEYVRLSLEILPSNDLTDDLKQRYPSIISSELKKVFPDYNASVRTNTTKLTGKFTQFIIIIKPKNSIGDMDLSKSGAADNRMEQLEDILTNLKMKIYNEYPQGGNATFSMQVQLPEECDDVTLDESVNSIRTAIMKALENDEYTVKLKLTEDFLGNNMTLKITALLHPNNAQENDEITKRLNLNNDEDDIDKELRSFLDSSRTEISQKLMNNLPVELKFVSSSAKVTDDSLIDDTASKVHRHVSKLYPNNKIDVKAIKDKEGNYILINILSRIPPTSPETLTVDLTAPGKSLREESSGIIQYINKVLSENHQKEEPLNIALDVKVSKNFTENQMENMTNSIVTIITQAFPNYSTKVDNEPILNLKENSASLYYLLSMKTKQKNHELNITSDGKNIIEDISQVLLNVTSQYEEFPTEGQFVNFLLKVHPTDKPTEEFVNDMLNRIQDVLPKLLPNYSVTMKTENEKDSEGFIADIKMFFSIQPKLVDVTTSDTTTKKSKIDNSVKTLLLDDFNLNARSNKLQSDIMKEFRDSIGVISHDDEPDIILHIAEGSLPHQISDNIFKIHLNGSGTHDFTELRKMLEILHSDIIEELKKDLEVNAHINIGIPKGITSNSIRNISEIFIQILREFFPNNKITLVGISKSGSRATLGMNIEPTDHIHMNIDLLETGDDFGDIIHEKFSKVINDMNFQNDVDDRFKATIVMNIKPPMDAKEEYLQTISKTLVTNFKEFFPNGRIYVKIYTKKDWDYLTEIHVLITIVSSQLKYIEQFVDIDLSKFHLDLNQYIDEKLSDVLHHTSVHLAQGLSITLNFNIKHFHESSEYVKNVTEQILNNIRKHLLYNEINMRIEESDKMEGNLFVSFFKINIIPLPDNKSNNFIQIVLYENEESIISQFNKTLSDKISNIEIKLHDGSPVTLYFNIIPPKGSNENYIEIILETLRRALESYFPQSIIDDKFTSTKDHRGNLLNIIAKIDIRPVSRKQKSKNVTIINLSKPGVNIGHEIIKIFMRILPYVNKKLNDVSSATLYFNIIPPKKSNDKFLNVITETLGTSLQKYLPSSNIRVKVISPKYFEGYLENILIEIDIRSNFRSAIIQNELTINLRETAGDIIHEINKFLQRGIIDKVKNELIYDSIATLNLNIIPPKESTKQFLHEISEILVTSLQKYLPSYSVRVKVSSRTIGYGHLTNVLAVITIGRNTQSELSQNGFSIDISKPGCSLSYEMEKIMNRIIVDVKKQLNDLSSVILYFNIIPPYKAPEAFMTEISEKLVEYVQNYLPSSSVKVKATSQKNGYGYLKNILAEILIKQDSQRKPFHHQIPIDLSESGANPAYEISKALSENINDITDNLNNAASSATLNFDVIPPKGADDDFLNVISDTLTTSLKKYFPSHNSKVKLTSLKNKKGDITDISAEALIEPNKGNQQSQNGLPIDLSQSGASPPFEIDKILTENMDDIKNKLNNASTATLNFDVIPPEGADDDFLNTLSDTLTTSLKKYFPSHNSKVKLTSLKNKKGHITDISAEALIEPNKGNQQSQAGLPIDLSQSGASAPFEIDKILTKNMDDIKNKLNNASSATLNFDVIPPEGADDDFLNTLSDTLTTSLKKYFPSHNSKMKLTSLKNKKGDITDISAEAHIEPNKGNQHFQAGLPMDLSQSGASAPFEIDKILTKNMDDIKNKLNNASSATLNFDVIPPEGADDDFLNTLSDTLTTSLKKYFPSHNSKVKLTSLKNKKGDITDISAEAHIEPNKGNQHFQAGLPMDLSQSGASAPFEIDKILTKNMDDIKNKLNNASSATLNFDVIPPEGADDDFLNSLSDNLTASLKKYFPLHNSKVKLTSLKNKKGDITDISAEALIEPNKGNQHSQVGVPIDLSKSGASAPFEIDKILTENMDDIKNKLNNASSATLNFDVIPPEGADDDFLNGLSDNLTASLKKYFPLHNSKVKLTSLKNKKGDITDISAEAHIEPNKGNQHSQVGVPIDLSKSGASAPFEIDKILTENMDDIKNKLNNASSATLNFDVIPPEGADDDFLNGLSDNLTASLKKYFPLHNSKVKLTSLKNKKGDITDISAEAHIEPNKGNQHSQAGLPMDLSQSGASAPFEIDKILTKNMDDIKNKLNNASSATLNFDVIPPEGADDDFLNTLSDTLTTSLKKYFPSHDSKVKLTSLKNKKGDITDISAEALIEPNKGNQQSQAGLPIDLSQSGANAPFEIDKILTKNMDDIKNKLNNASSATLNFDVIPPEGADDDFLNTLSDTLTTSLKKYFPSHDSKVKLTSLKNKKGDITDISAEALIEPKKGNQQSQAGLPIDLSQSSASAPFEIDKILSKNMDDIKNKLNNASSATLNFDVIPPEGADDDFLNTLSDTLTTSLKKYFPSHDSKVKLTSLKNKKGDITDISAEALIEPNKGNQQSQAGLPIDLSQSGANAPFEIDKILTKNMDDIKNKLNNASSATLNFDVIPPEGADDDFLNTLSDTLTTSLKKYFPSHDSKVKLTSLKNKKGDITDISAEALIEPNKGNQQSQAGLPIDLSQSSASAPFEIDKILSKNMDDIKNKLNNASSATLNFDVIPPEGADDDFLNTLSDTLTTSLKKYFPSHDSKVKLTSLKNKKGDITDISAEALIEPNKGNQQSQAGLPIDLSQSSASAPFEIDKILSKNMDDIKNKLNNASSATLNFDVIPPEGADDDFLNTLSDTLTTSLKKYFPSHDSKVKLTSLKNKKGDITDISAEALIEPNKGNQQSQAGLPIDLSQSSASAPFEIDKILTKNMDDIKNKLNNASSATLNFDVIPPEGADDDFLNTLSDTLTTSLKKYFPSHDSKVKLTSLKNKKGDITDISAEALIEPNKGNQQSQAGLPIDLSQSSASAPFEIDKILSKNMDDIKNKLNNASSATLNFDVIPPEGADDDFLNTLSDTLTTSLKKYFPSHDSKVKLTSLKNKKGDITDISAEALIEPNKGNQQSQAGLPIDLSQSGANAPFEIDKILTKNMDDIKNKLNNASSATLNFDVIPPEGADDDFLNTLSDTLTTSLKKYFPSHDSKVKLTSLKNKKGDITDISAEALIEPNKGNQQSQAGLPIDLSQSSASAPFEIDKILSKNMDDIKNKLHNASSATLNFDVIPPEGADDDFLNTLSDTLTTSLKKYFPSHDSKVKLTSLKNKKGDITDISAEALIEPNKGNQQSQAGLPIDLSQSSASAPFEIDKILSKNMDDIKNKLNNASSATLNFDVIPPEGADDDFLNTLSDTLTTSLKKYFPSHDSKVKLTSLKNKKGDITDISAEALIEPNKGNQQSQAGLPIDLSQSSASAPFEIDKILSKNMDDIKNKLNNASSATLNFDVIPPEGADDDFLNTLSDTLTTSLKKYFPSHDSKVKLTSLKNKKGDITDISAEALIEPNKENQQSQAGLPIDLSQSSASAPFEIDKILSKNMDDIKNKLNNASSATLNFDVIPPEGADDDFLNTLSDTLTTSLKKYFPSHDSKVKLTSLKNKKGDITDISAEALIEPNKGNQQSQAGLPIDLSQSGANAPFEIDKILTKNMDDIKNKLNNASSATLNFDVIPPEGADDNFLNTLSDTLTTSLKNYFPSHNSKVKLTSLKNNKGDITDITAEAYIEPNKENQQSQNGIDLSQSGASPPFEIDKILIKNMDDIKNKLNNASSATLNFDVMPPEGVGDDFINVLSNILATSLKKYFPSHDSKVKVTPQKNNQGDITDISVEARIEPNELKQQSQNGFEIDLSKPESSPPYEVSRVISENMEEIKNKLKNASSATLTFDVIPPEGAGDEFLNVLSNILTTSLNKYLPSHNSKVKVTPEKNNQGDIMDISVEARIEPNELKQQSQNGFQIDLSKPGSSPPDEVGKVISENRDKIKNKLKNVPSAALTFDVIPPEGAGDDFLNVLSNILVTSLNKYLPSHNSKVKVTPEKNNQGDIMYISVEARIEPNELKQQSQNGFQIDLSKPGSNPPHEVSKVINENIDEIQNKLNNASSGIINFNVIPPKETSEDFLNVISEMLAESLQYHLDSHNVEVMVTSQKNSQGFLTNIYAELHVEPIQQNQESQNGLPIDLSQSGSSPSYEVNKVLNENIDEFKKKLKDVSSATLYFNVIPPRKASEEFLNLISDVLAESLQNYLPSYNIKVTVTSEKNSKGYLTNIVAEAQVESIEKPELSLNQMPIDLSRQTRSSSPQEIDKILNRNINIIKQKLNEASSATIKFDVKPPKRASNDYLNVLSDTVLKALKKNFPLHDTKIKFTSRKNILGYIMNISAEVYIEPYEQNQVSQNGIPIDLSESGASPPYEINKIVSKNVDDIKNKLNDASSTTLNFDIIPPKGASDDFANVISDTLLTSLKKYFPSHNTKVKITSQKNNLGYITNITAEAHIEPNGENHLHQTGIPVDLSESGASPPFEIDRILTKNMNDIKSILNDSSSSTTLNFDIIPPKGASDDFAKVISDSLLTSLKKYFPSHNTKVKITSQKNNLGYITNISAEAHIEPNGENHLHQTGIPVDLSESGASPPYEIDKILAKNMNDIKNELNGPSSSTTLHFDIIPPKGASDEFINLISGTLLTSLNKYFPSHNTKVKITSQKNNLGYITSISAEAHIEPNGENQLHQTGIPVDLSESGASTSDEIDKILAENMNYIKNKLNDASYTTLNFDIIPPKGASDDYINVISEALVTTLKKYFPSYNPKMKIAPQKNDEGNTFSISVEAYIKANDKRKQSQNEFPIDLSTPGTSLQYELNKLLNTNLTDLKTKLNDKLTETLHFNVIPPNNPSENFVNDVSDSLLTVLKNYLPTKDVRLQISPHLDGNGYLTDITLIASIQSFSHNHPNKNEIDLSHHGVDLVYVINETLLDAIFSAKKDLNNGSPVTMSFSVIPPPKSHSTFIKRISDLFLAIFHKYLPSNPVTLNTGSQKNDYGFLSQISMEIYIEPYILYVDLSIPEMTLEQQLNVFLARIKNTVNDEIRHGQLVILTFNVKPPKKSTTLYQNTINKSIMSILGTFYPNSNVIQTYSNNNELGYLSEITTKIRIFGSAPNLPDTTPDVIEFKPQSFLDLVLDKSLPDLIRRINDDLQWSKSVKLSLPASFSQKLNQRYIDELSEMLARILKDYFPLHIINVSGRNLENQGHLSNIVFDINVATSKYQGPKLKYQDIDMNKSPVIMFQEIDENFNDWSKQLKREFRPVELHFDIRSDNDINTSLLSKIFNQFASSYSDYFSNKETYFKTKLLNNPGNNIKHLIVQFIVEKWPTTYIDEHEYQLKIKIKPRETVYETAERYVEKALRKIHHKKKIPDANAPISIRFNIKQKNWRPTNYWNKVSVQMLVLLLDCFTYNEIDIRTYIDGDSMTDILITIHPIDRTSFVKEQMKVNLDISSHDYSLPSQMMIILPDLIANLTSYVGIRSHSFVNFEIRPPTHFVDDFLTSVTNALIPYVTNILPGRKTVVVANANGNGKTINVMFDIQTSN